MHGAELSIWTSEWMMDMSMDWCHLRCGSEPDNESKYDENINIAQRKLLSVQINDKLQIDTKLVCVYGKILLKKFWDFVLKLRVNMVEQNDYVYALMW